MTRVENQPIHNAQEIDSVDSAPFGQTRDVDYPSKTKERMEGVLIGVLACFLSAIVVGSGSVYFASAELSPIPNLAPGNRLTPRSNRQDLPSEHPGKKDASVSVIG